MRIDLAHLAFAGLNLSLARAGHPEDRVSVQSGEGLSGRLLTDPDGVRLEEVEGAKLTLEHLLLTFGKLTLRALAHTQFEHLRSELRIQHGEASGSLHARRASATPLQVNVGSLILSAELELLSFTLELVGAAGQVRAEAATFRSLRVQSGELSLTCPALEAENLTIGWGDPAFRLDCDVAKAPEWTLSYGAWSSRASGIELGQVHVRGGEVQIHKASLARVEASSEFSTSAERPPKERAESSESELPLWDPALLDGLSGKLIADIEVDLSVPYLGHRRATHELRTPVENGSVDYLVLEKGLSRLEDSLLDFAVRDGALVLELGLPLISSRGRGKPIVIWDLSPEDYRLAEQNRVRLAVLPQLRLASARQSEPPADPSSGQSRFSLISLSVADVHTDLALAPRPKFMHAVLSELLFDALHVQGTVHHDAAAPSRAGLLRADADRVTCTLQRLALGSNELGLTVHLGRLEDATLGFLGTRLSQLTCALSELSFESVRLSARNS